MKANCIPFKEIMDSSILITVRKLHNRSHGAGGSDKQMLCASSGARAALNIAAEKSKQKR